MISRMPRFCLEFVVALFLLSTAAVAAEPPLLDVHISGLEVSASWSTSEGATAYRLYYAPYPFLGVDTIQSADMGSNTTFDITLWKSAAYYAAVTAMDAASESPFSNIVLVQIQDGTACAANDLSRCITVTDCTDAGGIWIDDPLWDERVCGFTSTTLVDESEGAAIANSDGSIVLNIGPDSLSQDVEITLDSFPSLGQLGVHEFGPDGLVFDTPASLTLRLNLNDHNVLAEPLPETQSSTGIVPMLSILVVDAEGHAELLEEVTIVNNSANKDEVLVNAELSHFSRVIVAAPAEFAVVSADYDNEQFVNSQFTVAVALDATVSRRSFHEYENLYLEDVRSSATGAVVQRQDMPELLASLYELEQNPALHSNKANLNYACGAQPGSGEITLDYLVRANGYSPLYGVYAAAGNFTEEATLSLVLPVNCIVDPEQPVRPGCTNPAALNYDPLADVDNGTCLFGNAGGDPIDFTLTPANISYLHSYGVSSCPQNVGSFEISNETDSTLLFELTPPEGLPIILETNSFSLPANDSRAVSVSFTCNTPYLVNGNISVQARFSDSEEQVTKTVGISGDVVGAP